MEAAVKTSEFNYGTIYEFKNLLGNRQHAKFYIDCVLFVVLGASRTQHNEQYTHHTYDMLPHHRIT